MYRWTQCLTLAASAVLLNSALGVAASAAARGAASLPQTSRLDDELRQTGQSLDSIAARTSRVEHSVQSARKRAQDVGGIAKAIADIDNRVSRIKRQIESISKIPQLRLVRPLVANLEDVRRQIHTVRLKTDKINREAIQPLIGRLKKVERKLETKVAEFRHAASQTAQTRRKVEELRSFVQSRGYQRTEVAALESLAKPARSAIHPLQQVVSQTDRSLGDVAGEFDALARPFDSVAEAKGPVQKLDRDLSPADQAARELDKVLSTRIAVKIFTKNIGFTVRQVLESPGKVLDVALKPLQKMADKALKPVLSKLHIQVQVPREIADLPKKFDGLKSVNDVADAPIAKVENALRLEMPKEYQNQIDLLAKTATSQLSRQAMHGPAPHRPPHHWRR